MTDTIRHDTSEEHGVEVDPVTGIATTLHSWDGIQELNNPLPRWWLWLFIITFIWSVGYWIAYPAWPMISDVSRGVLNWGSRSQVATEIENLKNLRGRTTAQLATASLGEIRTSPQLMTLAQAQGRVVFADNCAGCHGQGGGGAKSYPNLNDDDWLWGGSLEQIEHTIRFGARSTSDKGHSGNMPAFGRDSMLKRAEIESVANFVRSLSKLSVAPKTDLAAGAKIFADNCASCHGDNGKGKQELGAPDLTDSIWLFGPDTATIIEGISNGRGGVMPAWGDRLDSSTIKALTIYVHSLGGGR